MDTAMVNRPLGDLPPGADGTDPGQENKRNMTRAFAAFILAKLATLRGFDEEAVTALQMGVRALMKRHFNDMRRMARRSARQQTDNSKAAEPLSPEAELAATVARQKEAEA